MDELGDPDAPVGTRLWCLYIANEIRKMLYDKQQTGQRLRDLVGAFAEHQGWQELGHLSWEDFCERRLQKSPVEIEIEVTLRAQGRPSKEDKLDNCQVLTAEQMGGGNSADYLTARIARDRPDILEDMKQGKYHSVRQAAIEAGIVKPQARYSLPDDPQAAGKYLAQRVDREWFDTLIDAYYKALKGGKLNG
jgi:hypothetical protein